MARRLLIPSGAAPGQYGDGSNSAQITVDQYGRITKITSAAIGGTSGIGDKTEQGTYGSRPSADNDGDLYFSTDAAVLSRDLGTGNGYAHYGPIYRFTPPPASSGLTWVNQGSSTISDTAGGLLFTVPANSGSSVRALVKTAPATPYTFTIAFQLHAPGLDYLRAGAVFRQSSDGKMVYAALGYAGAYAAYIYKFDNATGFNSTYTNCQWIPGGGVYWLRIADNGTNRIISLSNDGQNFFALHTVSRTDFLTANQIGIAVDSNNANYGAIANFISWVEA